VALVTVRHAPDPDAHIVHGVLHVDARQQLPSLQTPAPHWMSAEHVAPGVSFATHVPLTSQ
jgi:hypothetical protein